MFKNDTVAALQVMSAVALDSLSSDLLSDQLLKMTLSRIEESKLARKEKARAVGRYLRSRARAHNEPLVNETRWAARIGRYDRDRQRLRKELRAMHLVRGFLSGVPYRAMENSVRNGNEPEIEEMLKYAGEFLDGGTLYNWISDKNFEPVVGQPDLEKARARRIASLNELLEKGAFIENAPEDKVAAFRTELAELTAEV